MYEWKTIKELRYWVHKVLPLVYDDSLSYYELLNKVVNKLNELIKNNDEIPDYVATMIESYISSGEIEQVVANMLSQNVVNVKYPPAGIEGAKGDGVTDDTDAFTACVNYAKANNKCVYVPTGSYIVNRITLDGVSMFGDDRYKSRIVQKGGATTPLISATGEVYIGNLYLSGNGGNQVNNLTVVDCDCTSSLLSNLYIDNGYNLLDINSANNSQINNVLFGNAVNRGLIVSGNGTVQGDNLYFNTIGSFSTSACIEINSNNNIIEKIKLPSAYPNGIVLNGNRNIVKYWKGNGTSLSDNGSNNEFVEYTYNSTEKEYVNQSISNALTEMEATIDGKIAEAIGSIESDVDQLTNQVEDLSDEIETLKLVSAPEMYGAVGDGVADDTTAVQNALDSGLIVFLKGKYKVTSALTFHNYMICGNGSLIAGTDLERLLTCDNDIVLVKDIELDGNNRCSLLLTCSCETGGIKCEVTNVYAHNTNNVNLGLVGCRGIAARIYKSITIKDCVVEHINRTNINPGVISSLGLYGEGDGTICIENNYVNDVKCEAETTDCDGIYVTSTASTDNTIAIIRNNYIKDSTGRFIKTQVKICNVYGNKGILVDSATSLFIKAVDYQWGGGECYDNIFDFADKSGRSSSFIHADWAVNPIRNLKIHNNIFKCTTEVQYLFYCTQPINGTLIIADNLFETVCDYLVTIPGESTGKVYIERNDFAVGSAMYRLINLYGSSTDLSGTMFTIVDNITRISTVEIFRNDAVTLGNLIVRGNKGINEVIGGAKTFTYAGLTNSEFEYDSVTGTLTNFPATLGHHFYIKNLTTRTFIYFEFSHGQGGFLMR